jgi:hypothetical protein
MAGRQIDREPHMEPDWKSANHNLSQAITVYRRDAPEVAAAFSGLAQAATKPGALDPKTKELIALAIGIAGRCDGCVGSIPRPRCATARIAPRCSRRSASRSTWAAARPTFTVPRRWRRSTS